MISVMQFSSVTLLMTQLTLKGKCITWLWLNQERWKQSDGLQRYFLKQFIQIYLFYVYEFSLHVTVCTTCVPGAHKGQKGALDYWELEFWVWEPNLCPLKEQ